MKPTNGIFFSVGVSQSKKAMGGKWSATVISVRLGVGVDKIR